MKRWQLRVAVVVLAGYCSIASLDAATIRVSIDGDSTLVPIREVGKNGGGTLFLIGEVEDEAFIFETANGRIVLGGQLDPDPAIQFVGAAFDFGAPSSFGFTFILPLAPPFSNPSFVFDSFSGSVTNGPAAGGVTVTALAPPPGIPDDGDGVVEMQVFTLSDDGGATWKNVGLDAGPSTFIPLPAFNSGLYGMFNQGPIATIAGGPWTHMRADVNFMLSGGNDVFTFNGAKVLVPEPGAIVMVLGSLLTICFFRSATARRRQ